MKILQEHTSNHSRPEPKKLLGLSHAVIYNEKRKVHKKLKSGYILRIHYMVEFTSQKYTRIDGLKLRIPIPNASFGLVRQNKREVQKWAIAYYKTKDLQKMCNYDVSSRFRLENVILIYTHTLTNRKASIYHNNDFSANSTVLILFWI